VDSVWASSAADERSYSEAAYELDGTFRDGGDWMQGFLEDWRDAPRGDALADALQRSSESAEEKMPERFTGDQHPTGWRRGELPVLAHVERPPRSGKLELHFFAPEFLRSRTLEVDVAGVELPANLVASNWVGFTGAFDRPADPPRVAGPVTRSEPPAQSILAHVETVGRKRGRRYLKVHTVRPKWLYSKKQRLWLDDGAELPADLRVCSWLEGDVRIEDPEATMSTAGPLRRATPTFSAKVHATGTINHQTGVFRAHLLDPSWLRCQRRDIQLPEAERGLLRNLRSCDNVLLELDLGDFAAGRYPGSRAAIVRRDRGEWGPTRDVATNLPGERTFVVGGSDEGEERRVVPAVGVTNVGEEAVSLPVRAVLGPAAAEPALRAWLEAEETAPPKEALWSGESEVADLAPGATAEALFDSWLPPEEGGRFWVGFRAALAGDENPASDVRGVGFEVPPAPEAVEPPPRQGPPEQAPAEQPPEQAPAPAPPAAEVTVPPGAQVVDMGTVARGAHPFPITAVNESCRGKHDFRASFEPAAGSPGGWFRIEGPDTLRRIGVGESKTTQATVDLRSVPAGPLAGILRVVCISCPPPPVCTQNESVFVLRLAVPE
ncbi:MAG TPA: hypothetical protein VMT16_11740, partial [Thermoanaerobaculia bacterium]|nr:hypothetical protein [Thermoanaerobaculia bacterium]